MSRQEFVAPPREATARELERIYGPVSRFRLSQPYTFADLWEDRVRKSADEPFIYFEGKRITFGEMNAAANRLVRTVLDAGVHRGETVALMMGNRPEYLMVWLGLAKAGIVTAFVNPGARGRVLAHALEQTRSRALIYGPECLEHVETLSPAERPALTWQLGPVMTDPAGADASGFDKAVLAASGEDLPVSAREGVTFGHDFVYIFTSGTTGLPKAARIPHGKFIVSGEVTARAMEVRPGDVHYCVLPLFHGAGGMVVPSTCVYSGIPFVLRRKFSASEFWNDVRRYRITLLQYVGEICRYLVNRPPTPEDRNHTLRCIYGAGLRRDVWLAFRERFAVPRIIETWGGTEVNGGLQNLDGPVGSCGRIPFPERSTMRLVRYDVETDSYPRGPDGFCIACGPGEVGEMLCQILDIPDVPAGRFDGYTSKEQTEARILKDAFAPGDRWYRTGDLFRYDEDGYYYFVDRIGDTFRWKSENVSTEEVALVLSGFPGPSMVNVYGVRVPNTEGRAGMVALTYDDVSRFDPVAFYAFASSKLQHYAVPVFVRIMTHADLTDSFKLRKFALQSEGYDHRSITDPLYVADPAAGRYVPVTDETLRALGIAPFERSADAGKAADVR